MKKHIHYKVGSDYDRNTVAADFVLLPTTNKFRKL